MSDISVSDADGVVLINELEKRFGFMPIIVANEQGKEEVKCLVPKFTVTIDPINEEE